MTIIGYFHFILIFWDWHLLWYLKTMSPAPPSQQYFGSFMPDRASKVEPNIIFIRWPWSFWNPQNRFLDFVCQKILCIFLRHWLSTLIWVRLHLIEPNITFIRWPWSFWNPQSRFLHFAFCLFTIQFLYFHQLW